MTHSRFNAGRRRFLSSAAAAGAMTLGSPLVLRAQNSELNITGWGGKWGEVFEATVGPMFEKEYNCKIVRDTSFPFVPKLQASSRRNPIYDVVHSNQNAQAAAVVMGLVEEKLDPTNIPNMAELYDYATSDTINGVCMFTSAIGMGYRKDLVKEVPTSWTDLWKEEYADKRGAYVIPINSLGQAFLTMAASIYGSGAKDLDAAYEALEKLKPIKLVDFTGAMEKMILSGEVELCVIHDSGVLRYYDTPNEAAFCAPKEGVLALEQVLNITPGTQKRELAEAYINFMLSPEIQKTMAEAVWYSPANKNVVLSDVYQERLLTTPEKVAQLKQVDWMWYNANKDAIDMRVNRIFRA
ncbi:ABC transporter substrate-binding protein [Salipiger sp. P9]|uniref:ABC transporter substrate-binding protein n=1 Tax=Salipiger pentaromativorans TaxID=2943193 RepID=UPI002157F255|nr:ABC transporter substrate-binding protein [Salipiger pentaromativorans]MCR8546915.1 ABC transporter substrate-binding protein [Salipiger pentaromativorans]